jgi:hypothetical protein
MRKHKRKLWVVAVVVMSLVLQVSCEDSTLETTGTISSIVHILGGVAIAIAGIIWAFKNKIRDFIEGRKNIKLLVAALTLVLFTEGKILAADISFQPAVNTFYTIMLQFASITAGACGFFGLTRVAWLLVNEERTAGTALIMSIIGFVVATIAVGIL